MTRGAPGRVCETHRGRRTSRSRLPDPGHREVWRDRISGPNPRSAPPSGSPLEGAPQRAGCGDSMYIFLARQGLFSGQPIHSLPSSPRRRGPKRRGRAMERDGRNLFTSCGYGCRLRGDDSGGAATIGDRGAQSWWATLRFCPTYGRGSASMSTKATVQGVSVRLLQAWLVPRWIRMSPAFNKVSSSSINA